MTIALACDHAGYALKEEIKTHLLQEGYECKDFGTFSAESCDYPDYAYKAAKSVASGECERGVLVCGTGIGMSIVANKVKGIRCALCAEEFSARATRQHNDSNVLALGARVIDAPKAKLLTDIFLTTEFEGGRHRRRLDKITRIEENACD